MGTIVLNDGAPGFHLEISDEIEDGRYAQVKLRSNLGQATRNVYSLDLRKLEVLNRTLTGAVEMEALEHDFIMRFEMKSLGKLQIAAKLMDHLSDSEFRAVGEFDQSYLPTFLKEARQLSLVPLWMEDQ
jgi:hypothetical protein